MLDIKFIRDNPEKVRKACEQKRVKADIDELLDIDRRRREALQGIEDMRAKKNKANQAIKEAADGRERGKIILEMQELDKGSDRLDKNLKELEDKFHRLMCKIPNICLKGVPVGGEKDSKVLKKFGKVPKFDFKPKDYMEIGEELDVIDVKRAAKIAGTRFGFLKGKAALLELALVNFAFDILVKKGFMPVIPPVMIKSEMARGMGFIQQTDDEEAYYLPKDDLFLIATSEQALGSMHSGEVFEEKDLIKRYAGFSTCFRREAGSYGKDTKGILRVHQFDKVEMFSFAKPEDSEKEHKFLLEIQKELMDELKLPYQVVNIASGDLGLPAAAKYDIETWIPSENRYRETHSTSNCTDFQARRLNIRYRDKKGVLCFVHTLNGTAFAVGRMIIAILENYQQKDGSIKIPEVLQKYLNFKEIK
ncbi:MAG: serine--tRNA ligase [Candidatus Nealsonbacteria bacterium]|nr:serine--tRNA ligase [Candidatus Nealsonbacteria bacterium]